MDALERTLIEKAGYANGFENVRESTPERVVLTSARHTSEAHIGPTTGAPGLLRVTFPNGPSGEELARSFPDLPRDANSFDAADEVILSRLLRRAAELAMSLPNHAADRYSEEVAKIEASSIDSTETIRLVKQRVGQDLFRQALVDYWGGACAVTGIAVPELLRASHAKPWASCETDSERLNVFNGFLLCAHFDALFDRGLMTFDETGRAVFSPNLDEHSLRVLNLTPPPRLRWITPQHEEFLSWHRSAVFKG